MDQSQSETPYLAHYKNTLAFPSYRLALLFYFSLFTLLQNRFNITHANRVGFSMSFFVFNRFPLHIDTNSGRVGGQASPQSTHSRNPLAICSPVTSRNPLAHVLAVSLIAQSIKADSP